jgi:pSer/pThr/pTyr-binding forkhead associated (FHA) protein
VVFKLRDTKTQQAIPLPEGTLTVGREENNDIVISDASVSRRHALITNENDGIFVEDLGSSNGTAVRGEFIASRTQVNVGDVVFFGSISFRVEPEVARAAATPQPEAKKEIPVTAGAPVAVTKSAAQEKGQRVGIHFDSAPLPSTLSARSPQPEAGVPSEGFSDQVATTEPESMTTLQLPRVPVNAGNPAKSAPLTLPAPVSRGSGAPRQTMAGSKPTQKSQLAAPQDDLGEPPMPSPWTGWVLAFLVGLMLGIVVGFLLARFVVV